MKPVVEKLTAEDLVAIGAYTASLPPQAAARQTARGKCGSSGGFRDLSAGTVRKSGPSASAG